MKKTIVLAVTAVFLAAMAVPGLQAAEKKAVKAKPTVTQQYNYQEVKAPKNEGITIGGWILMGLDVALAGLTVYTVLDERDAAAKYNTLLLEIDNTNQANFDLLTTKKTEIDGKILFAGVSSGLLAAAALYTLADVFLIHAAFPASPKVSYNPENKAIMFSLNRGF